MIQRRQTLWLGLISLICFISVSINIPFLEIEGKLDGRQTEDALASIGFSFTEIDIDNGSVEIIPNEYLRYASLLCGTLAFISIFLYKHHKRQILLGNIIYLAIIIILFCMYYYGWSKRYVDLEPENQIIISVLFPFLMLFANFKALKGIKKDLGLIQSYDRIR